MAVRPSASSRPSWAVPPGMAACTCPTSCRWHHQPAFRRQTSFRSSPGSFWSLSLQDLRWLTRCRRSARRHSIFHCRCACWRLGPACCRCWNFFTDQQQLSRMSAHAFWRIAWSTSSATECMHRRRSPCSSPRRATPVVQLRRRITGGRASALSCFFRRDGYPRGSSIN